MRSAVERSGLPPALLARILYVNEGPCAEICRAPQSSCAQIGVALAVAVAALATNLCTAGVSAADISAGTARNGAALWTGDMQDTVSRLYIRL